MRPGRLQLLRLWLLERREQLGLPLAAILAAVLLGLLLYITVPLGPGEPATGVVVGMGYSESSDDAGHPFAEVKVQGRPATVDLPQGAPCKVGDTILLRLRPTHWGNAYAAAPNPCPFNVSGPAHAAPRPGPSS